MDLYNNDLIYFHSKSYIDQYDILEFAKNCKLGITYFITSTRHTNVPISYSHGFVLRRGDTATRILYFPFNDNTMYSNNCDNGEWSGWAHISFVK